MKADEIMHVLRLAALGRINTPQQEEFCERLEKLFAQGESSAQAVAVVADEAAQVKRARKPKAE